MIKSYQITLFWGFWKAFDTASQDILLKKPEAYGIRGPTLTYFSSYVNNNRKQYVYYKKYSSDITEVRLSVPQGSILRPILYLLYINDNTSCYTKLKFLYANGTSVYMQPNNLPDLVISFNQELGKVTNWIGAERLVSKSNKTHFILSHHID